jgi:hypothetical protein
MIQIVPFFKKDEYFRFIPCLKRKKNSSQWHRSQAAECLLLTQFFFHIIPSSEDLLNHKVFKVGTLLFADQEALLLTIAGLNLPSN